LTIGFTHFSQLHPGSKIALPTVTSLKFARSIFPFSNVRVSSGEESKLFSAFSQLLLLFLSFKQRKSFIISIATAGLVGL
jgi:hypothetical protein